MQKKKFFIVNGQKYFTFEKITILDLVVYFHYKREILILEYNHTICNKNCWNDVVITNNDKIEFITIVGGG